MAVTIDEIDLKIVREIASRMQDPNRVREASLLSSIPSRPSPWHPFALSHGYPGVLMLMAALDSLYPDEKWDQVAHSYVLKIIEGIETGQVEDLSLFGGIAGICLAISFASRGQTRYQRLMNTLNDHLLQKSVSFYFIPLRENLDLKLPSAPHLYDPISGITGIGLYLLHHRGSEQALSCLKKVINFCIELTQDIKVEGYKVPGWYVPHQYQFTAADKSHYPKGNFNLGIAHGITGVLAFLSIAALHGIVQEGQMEAIDKVTGWLCAKRKLQNGVVLWPNRISFEEEILGKQDQTISMNAWCYGTPGVARVLYLAGCALRDTSIQALAEKAFFGVFEHKQMQQSVISPTFCHGFAGLLSMTQLMARDTQSAELYHLQEKLEKELLRFYRPENVFGFRDRVIFPKTADVDSSPVLEFDKAGILKGASGILLALLASRTNNFSCGLPFLVEQREL